MADAAWSFCADVSTEVEVIIIRADSVTRLPLLNTIVSAPEQPKLWCAEVRAGDDGSAVIIAETPVSIGSGVA